MHEGEALGLNTRERIRVSRSAHKLREHKKPKPLRISAAARVFRPARGGSEREERCREGGQVAYRSIRTLKLLCSAASPTPLSPKP